MADTRVVPSGKVYRQMFDAQVQLSRTLQVTRRGRLAPAGPDSGGLPSEASADASSPTHREHWLLNTGDQLLSAVQCNSITEQQCHVEVRGLPDEIVIDRPSSDIIERLREKRESDHRQAVGQLYKDLSVVSQDYEVRYRQACGQLLSYLSEQQQRLDNLMEGMDNTEHLQHFTLQKLCSLWDTVSEETTLKKRGIRDLDRQLTGYESDRANDISLVLRKYSRLLEKISFLLPSDLHRLLDTEAMMINQALLANRRSVSRLLLHLQEAELQQESVLRFRWEELLVSWRRSQVHDIITNFRDQTSSDAIQKPSVMQQTVEEMRTAQRNLLEQRCHVIQDLCSLAPPTCSTSLVADWFEELTAVNQKIDSVNVKYLQQLTFYYEEMWQSYLTEMEHSKVALNALGLSEEEVQDIVSSHLLSLIGRHQSQAEQRLATLDREFEALAEHARSLSRSVCAVIGDVALLWETHCQATETTDHKLQQLLDTLRQTQQQEVQKKESQLDMWLDRLRQESTEDGLRNTLDKSLHSLDQIKQSYSRWFSELGEVVDRYPVTVLEQLHTYSTAFSQYYDLNNTHTLSSDELHALYPSINTDMIGQSGITQQPMTEKHPIGSPNPSKLSPDWLLPEARCRVAELYDSVHTITFTSSGGGAYSGPALKCPAHKPTTVHPEPEPEVEFTPFPVEQLSRSLTRFRALCVDHVEQRFHSMLSSAVAAVSGRREALCSEHNSLLKLHEQRKQHILMGVHNTRVGELMLHRDSVESHCQLVLQELTSCRKDFLFLQTSTDKMTEDFRTQIYNKEEQFMHARTSDSLASLFSSLQDRLDEHLEVTQNSQKVFRQSVLSRLNQLRNCSSALLKSFRLFSEGGNFSPKEVQSLLRRLEKSTKRIDTTEETLKTDMEVAESKSIGQAKEVVSRFEEKFNFLTVELKFQENIQNVLTNTQVLIKTEVANNNSQKSHISSRLLELKTMMDSAELSSEEACSFLSSVSEEIRARCRYLDCFLDPSLSAAPPQRTLQGPFALAARPKSSAPPTNTVPEPCRRGVVCSDDAALGVVKHLNRMCRIQDVPSETAENDQRRTTTSAGQKSSSSQRKSASRQSMRRLSKPNRKDPRFLVFGNEPSEQTAQCFMSIVSNMLWKANDILLLIAEDFYKQATHQTDSFDVCAVQINTRLLGYKQQVNLYYNVSLQEFREQLCVLEEGVCGFPRVLFLNHTHRYVTAMLEQTAAIRQDLDHTIRTSMETKRLHVSQLSVRLSHPACEEELSALRRREDDRQTQLAGTINRTYQELQECVRVSGEEFVKTLASLAEKLLFQMDNLLTVDQMMDTSLPTGDRTDNLLTGDQLNTGETESRRESVTTEVSCREEQQRGSRTWPGVCYLSPPADSPERHTPSSPAITATTASSPITMAISASPSTMAISASPSTMVITASPATMPITASPATMAIIASPATMAITASPVTVVTTASITTAKSSLGHLAVTEHRDAQLQLFEEVYRSELLHSHRDRDGHLTELQRWTEHWTHQIHTLTQLIAE